MDTDDTADSGVTLPSSPPPNPAIQRQELGARLRALRQAAGMTIEDVAGALIISSTKVSRMETASRGIGLRDIRDLSQLYNLSREEHADLVRLAQDSRRRSYWRQFGSRISDYAELEEAAATIADYESALVPALLQTGEYATALAAGTEFQGDPLEREQAVRARLTRQKRLDSDRPPNLATVIDEAVVRRMVGNRAIMARQLRFVADRARAMDHVTVQVLPFVAGAHPGMDSTFTILHFTEAVSDLVFVEGLVGSIYLKKRGEVERYQHVFGRLQDLALPPADSVNFIVRAAETFD